jgi:hypothetical protein
MAMFFSDERKMEFIDLFGRDEKLNKILYLAGMFSC